MIYQPQQVAEMWDTWLFYHQGIHYLYYLHKSTGKIWDGISLATSTDGVHFIEIGPVIVKKADAEWLGSGSVWRSNDHFVMCFSENHAGFQEIFFAQSGDLIHWNRLPDTTKFSPDQNWYQTVADGPGIDPTRQTHRWDCICAHKQPDGSFVGYFTAKPKDHEPGLSWQTIGLARSNDGTSWCASPPPTFEWGDWPKMNCLEVSGFEKIGDTYYLLMTNSENLLGNRFFMGHLGGKGGTYVFIAEKPEGPFHPDYDAYRLITSSVESAVFARFYPIGSLLLLNHHTVERSGEGPARVWMSPLKQIKVDSGGHLRVIYWKGNEALKGNPIPINLTTISKEYPPDTRLNWRFSDNSACLIEPYNGGIITMSQRFNLRKGMIFEGKVTLEKDGRGWGGAGFYICHSQDEGAGVLLESRQLTEFGSLTIRKYGSFFVADDVSDLGIEPGKSLLFRMLIRHTMLELYLEDKLVACYNLPFVPSGKVGFMIETGSAIFEEIKAWEMSLE